MTLRILGITTDIICNYIYCSTMSLYISFEKDAILGSSLLSTNLKFDMLLVH